MYDLLQTNACVVNLNPMTIFLAPFFGIPFQKYQRKLINDINKEDSKLTKLTENIHYLQKWVKRRKSPENTFNSAGL